MLSHQKPTIAIVGGGLAGLTLSIGLTRKGIPHTIYESAAKFAEIGAGIALGPNSITALELIDPRIKDVLKKCVSYNEGLDGQGEGVGADEWLDIRIGEEQDFNSIITTIRHTGSDKPGRACVHRAKFLEGLIDLIPPSTAVFGKSLTSITEVPSTGKLSLSFADGTSATADAIIACDGIKSVARQNYVLTGPIDQKISRPVFTNDVAYRGMFPRDRFSQIVDGAISTGKGNLFCGPSSYVVMYPVEKGAMMNVVAIKNISSQKSQATSSQRETNWVQNVTQETMLEDFEGWGAPIKALLKNIESPQRWALYDHLPASTFVKGRVALMGDAAHATTPHQGQGAGMAFEDSLVLSNILGQVLNEAPTQESEVQETVHMNKCIESCLQAYDEVRRLRTQKVTATSREMGEIIGFAGKGIGRDLGKLKANLDVRMNWIWDVDLPGEITRGVVIARKLNSSV
ncbi:FAD/NAD(P)-binding protein [Glarea lozoyensis ATCC 20868]|uniref:FAD/NAD(P)-binding protein n=1 Tax=Glarea lozoyensis (strain ATCC 20868 / MF5171) TaxID=1116229 RepID=S3DT38_GLAL2|nr:FAD/NAD(P)-binding protein [Glarea lozoyensis ATCC 20868]EPE35131.1 FAD/NAD(P)-binding protein [Glarea lozoyensis ATCC 20868]